MRKIGQKATKTRSGFIGKFHISIGKSVIQAQTKHEIYENTSTGNELFIYYNICSVSI